MTSPWRRGDDAAAVRRCATARLRPVWLVAAASSPSSVAARRRARDRARSSLGAARRACASCSASTPGSTRSEIAIVEQIRLPRVVLGLLVGLDAVAVRRQLPGRVPQPAGRPVPARRGRRRRPRRHPRDRRRRRGLGHRRPRRRWPPSSARSCAVALTYVARRRRAAGGASTASLILAGVAVATFLTAVQTYVQQRNQDTIREVYTWILGRLLDRRVGRGAPAAALRGRHVDRAAAPTGACSTCSPSATTRRRRSGSTPRRTPAHRGRGRLARHRRRGVGRRGSSASSGSSSRTPCACSPAAATAWSCRCRCCSAARSSCLADLLARTLVVAGRDPHRRRHRVLRRAVLRARPALRPAHGGDGVIALRGRLGRRSATSRVLDGVDARRAERASGSSIVGPNGAGKTTLLRYLAGARARRTGRARSSTGGRAAELSAAGAGPAASPSCRSRR